MILKDAKKPDIINKQANYSDRQVEAPFLRTPYNYDREAASNDTGLSCKDPSLTQQQFKDDCDINVLFARYLETGEIPQLIGDAGPKFGDFTGIYDYQTAMNEVRTAQGLFDQLPARIKNRFDNDPQKLLEFLNDPENLEEARFLGLVNKEKDDAKGTTAAPAPAPQGPTGPSGTQSSTEATTTTKSPGSEASKAGG